MDDKKGPQNGSYTQVPNVFFDTCDLPESAQILYLRLYRHIAYKDDHKFTGSIRKLSSFLRLSKSTVERMIKVLEESLLINVSYESSQEQDRKIMTITINPQELWLLNKQHYEDNDVPNWDKVMPVVKILSQIGTLCPDMGQDTINLGQNNVNLGQTVPDTSSKSAQETISTTNDFEEREKESEVPTSAQELPTLSQPVTSSPSLSQKNDSSFSSSPEEMKPTKEAKPTPVDYALFDRLCRSKGYAIDFRVPRDEKNNAAIKKLREQGANAEQVEFVFNDIWDDKDPFWQQHRGNPSTVASQFTARVWKMTAPAQKRRTASGFPNWTEDKTMGVPAIVEPTVPISPPEPTIMPTPKPTVASVPTSAPAKPKEITLPAGYTRLPDKRPARPRTAWGRRQAAKEVQEGVMK